MSTGPVEPVPVGLPLADGAGSATPEQWVAELGTLLSELETPAETAAEGAAPAAAADEQWARRRLGIADSLFAALRCKHGPTAAHSLRVALCCSAWTAKLAWERQARQQIEIAALLHDVGVIGVPDHVLLKPGALDSAETAMMGRTRAMSLDILRYSCKSPEILAIVAHVGTWYDGFSAGGSAGGQEIPLASRMIAVAEAFDAMTSDRIYRPAMSQERATIELFHCAGTQFDPEVVRHFVEFCESARPDLPAGVASRWLRDLDPEAANVLWDFHATGATPAAGDITRFCVKFLDNMYDAVVFVDAGGRIRLWNHGAERLTGISGATVRQRAWSPDILDMADEKAHSITAADCPVRVAIESGVQSLRRLSICGRNGRCLSVDAHAIPVIADDGSVQGAILVLHDASSEISLEHRCQSLADKATRDPLTQVANRAEFDRVHKMFIDAHQQQKVPCSLLICDLDLFKLVNDNYGHQAGDEMIKSLAALLKGACRAGDLVARYGGEEFVMLMADCDNAAATRRAEQIRKTLAAMPQPKLNSKAITASFGVTEVQPGDTPETMLRRADRGLLMAKEAGRNRVVQLGSGSATEPGGGKPSSPQPAAQESDDLILETLITPVPAKMTLEKLRGFVADHDADVVKIDDADVQLEICEKCTSLLRRLTDRPVTFRVHLHFEEQNVGREAGSGKAVALGAVRTKINIGIGVRRAAATAAATTCSTQQVLISFRSYLMAIPLDEDNRPAEAAMGRMKSLLRPSTGR